jgi:pimeloyl-ACP methyl ester carboxylesterase
LIILPPNGLDIYDEAMADAGGVSASIIGFSFGGMTAMEIASARPEQVRELKLIAPCAPLELGDYLKDAAGKDVFEAAMKSDPLLRGLAFVQAIAVRFFFGPLMKNMFASSPDAEKALLGDPAFIAMLKHGARRSLIEDRAGYCDAMLRYVKPWGGVVKGVNCPVDIWHGSADGWAPPAMSEALIRVMENNASLTVCEGLAHYTTLKQELPAIVSGYFSASPSAATP